ncbi:hypothetical protein BESB_060890 [Besnoitia besnoiti]|uniref:Uncharacterized protein n=1 Tax=Besnoitia besnoiti TaxID=94643 RepID=A0A2A9MII5_BESBE|nr:hypothetical protein BESB_060890 [Besnoitia besnoiti]PFH35202.1 hypothetical protein BESB_060890 [Besnoitia besnoiti]
MIGGKLSCEASTLNHTVDIQRPQQKWTPLQLLPAFAKSDHPELMQHLARLKQEIADLHDYNERVTKELRILQLKHASDFPRSGVRGHTGATQAPDAAFNEEGNGGGDIQLANLPLPAWTLDMQLMCPLISAYDRRIKDQQVLLERRETDVETLTSNIMTLTKENETLRTELRNKTSQLQALFASDGGSDNGAKTAGKTVSALLHEKRDLEELYSVTQEQTKVLLDQNHLMKTHVEHCEHAMASLRSQMKKVAQDEAACNQVRRQNDALQQLLEEAKTQLEALIEERDMLRSSEQKHRLELTTLKQTFSQLQQENSSLHQRVDDEHRIAQEAQEASKSKEAERKLHLQALETELAELQENFMQLSHQSEDADREAEKAREIIDYLEGKTVSLERENEQVKNNLTELQQKYQELAIEKEKLSVSASVVKKQLDEIREQHASEIALQRSMMDDRFEGTISQLQQQVEQLRQRSQDLAAANSDLTLRTEAAERRCKLADADAGQAKEELRSASKSQQALVQQLQQTKISVEKERDKLREDLDAVQKTTAAKLSAMAAEKQRMESELVEARFALSSGEQAKRHAEASVETLKRQVAELSSRNTSMEGELVGIRRRHETEIEQVKRNYAEKLAHTESKLRSLEHETHIKEQAIQLKRKEEEHRQNLKREYEAERDTMELKMTKLRSSNSQLRSKVVELVHFLEQPTSNKDSYLALSSSHDISSLRSACTKESLL